MNTVKLSGAFGDEVDDLLRLCTELIPITSLHDGEPWALDLREVELLGAYAASVLGGLYLSAIEKGQQPSIQLPDSSDDLRVFFENSVVEKLIEPAGLSRAAQARLAYVPLTQFFDSPWSLIHATTLMLSRHADVDADFEEYLGVCISESAQNVIDHAQSPTGGVMCSCYHDNTNCVSICICDFGIGIAESLRQGGKDFESFGNALRQKVWRGITSKSQPTNQGLGIKNLLDAVRECEGNMVLLSSGRAFSVEQHDPYIHVVSALVPRPQTGNLAPQVFPGTVVAVSLPVKKV